MANISVKMYLLENRRNEPIQVVYGSNAVGISIELLDVNIPAGSSAIVLCQGERDARAHYQDENISINGNTVTFIPKTGFFRPGMNRLQFDIENNGTHVVTFQLKAKCTSKLGEGEDPATVEEVLPYIEEAREKAAAAIEAAAEAQRIKDSIPADYSTLAGDVSELKEDLAVIAEDGTYRKSLVSAWNQGRYNLNSSTKTITFDQQATFCNPGYIDLTGLDNSTDIRIKVPSGYNLYWLQVNTNTGTYTQSTGGPGWMTDGVFTTHRLSGMSYMLCNVYKTGNVPITPGDVESVTISVSVNIKTQNDVDALTTVVTANSEDIDFLEKEIFEERKIKLACSNGRIVASNNALTIQDNAEFARTQYLDMRDIGSIKVSVASGYQYIVWIADNDSGVFVANAPQRPIPSWQTAENTFKLNSTLPYLIVSVMRVGGGSITPSDADSVLALSTENAESLEAKVNKLIDHDMSGMTVPVPTAGQIIYAADTKANGDHIVNAVAYSDGVIVACRHEGEIVRIGYDGTEQRLLQLNGHGMDWRCLWMDSHENVFASPHASWGSLEMSERGLYKLAKGAESFVKVLSFDNSTEHDDTIWTMCEDRQGYIYAGVYCHTKRFRPRIYRSSNGGDSWTEIANFTSGSVVSGGHHIHTIIYSPYQDALYTIVGEVNTILKSTDHGVTWQNLNVQLTVKGSAMYPTPYGILIGSDGSYNCDIDILLNDDKSHKKVFRGWANTVFAIRCSDVTGMIYAFTKIDSSVNVRTVFPPATVLELADPWTGINEWKSTVPDIVYQIWKDYYDSVIDKYPDDAIRPQHYSILVSRDGGAHWEVLKSYRCASTRANGCWTTGYFRNGECLTGVYDDTGVPNPLVISEGKHRYTSDGVDLSGEIFVRTNSSSTVSLES